MTENAIRVLYVDDYVLDRALVNDSLLNAAQGFDLIEAESREQFDAVLHAQPYDIVLSDFNILGFTGLEVLDKVHREIPGTPVIIVTGTGSEEIAAEAIKRGASDYVIKSPDQIRRLPHIIQQALETQKLRNERIANEKALRESDERYRSLVQHTNEAIFCYEYDPPIPTDLPFEDQIRRFYTGRLVECNEVAARFYGGKQPADVLGKQLIEVFQAFPGGPVDALFTEFIQNNYQIVEGEGVETLEDGSQKYYANNAHGVVENNHLRRVWGFFRDITRRKLAQEQEREMFQVAEALQDTALALSSTLEFDQVLDRILENVGQVLTADAVNFMLIVNDSVSIVRHRGYEEKDWETWDKLSFSIDERPNLARMLTTRQPAKINDTHTSPNWEIIEGGEWIRSYAAAPVVFENGEVIGFLNLDHSTPDFFEQKHIDWLMAFSNQVAIALKNAQTQKALHQRTQDLWSLTVRLAETEEAERLRLARELHDQVGQSLAVLSFNLNMLQDSLQTGEKEALLDQLEQSIHVVAEISQGIRGVMDDLRPSILDDYGLQAALHWMTDRFSTRTQIKTQVIGPALEPRLPANQEIAFFRITQEALTNIARHSGAEQVTITLKETNNAVFLSIQDDGGGFNLTALRDPTQRRGWGLENMRERATVVGGTVQIDSQIGQGTQIKIQIPRATHAD